MDHFPAWYLHPDQEPPLGPEPCIDPTAIVQNSTVRTWTEIGAFATVVDSSLDDYSYIAPFHASIMYTAIGKFTSIASHVRINPTNHPMDRVTQHHCTYRRRQYGFDETDDASVFKWRQDQAVTIGHDVWIGHGAIVLPGVTVGNGAVIGAGAVVSRDVAPYQVVVGSPARPIRMRFDARTVAALQDIGWWHWDHAVLKKRFGDLLDPDRFISKYSRQS